MSIRANVLISGNEWTFVVNASGYVKHHVVFNHITYDNSLQAPRVSTAPTPPPIHDIGQNNQDLISNNTINPVQFTVLCNVASWLQCVDFHYRL